MLLGKLIAEFRRRRVFRAAGYYIVAAWVAIQVADLIFPAINVPESALLYVWLVALLLFPLALIFAWFFNVTVQGITRTPGAAEDDSFDPSLRAVDYAELAMLAVLAVAITWHLSSCRKHRHSGRYMIEPSSYSSSGLIPQEYPVVLP